jgi:hypothetical protein
MRNREFIEFFVFFLAFLLAMFFIEKLVKNIALFVFS